MKNRQKEISIPFERHETERRAILSSLEKGQRSAKELSFEVSIPEKEIYDHLEHIRRSLNRPGWRLIMTPAECKKCGFVFSKRERFRKPGKCPVCKGEAIYEPLFSVEGGRQGI